MKLQLSYALFIQFWCFFFCVCLYSWTLSLQLLKVSKYLVVHPQQVYFCSTAKCTFILSVSPPRCVTLLPASLVQRAPWRLWLMKWQSDRKPFELNTTDRQRGRECDHFAVVVWRRAGADCASGHLLCTAARSPQELLSLLIRLLNFLSVFILSSVRHTKLV